MIPKRLSINIAIIAALLSACTPNSVGETPGPLHYALAGTANSGLVATGSTPLPVRENYKPAQLVDYIAQSGDTLPSLAAHFNTTVAEIRSANPVIPADATTMPPGFPMKIPIYFESLWSTPFKMVPDSAFVDGPADVGFNTSAFVAARPGWLRNYRAYAGYQYRTGAEIVDYVATNYSVSPRLLLAILEYKAGALSQPNPPDKPYIMDYPQPIYEHASYLVYTQLFWAANTLNNGYYGWRSGKLTEFDLSDGTIIRPDPWQNAATVGLEYFFSLTTVGTAYDTAVGVTGLAKTYAGLFGDPWRRKHLPNSGQPAPTGAYLAFSARSGLDFYRRTAYRLGRGLAVRCGRLCSAVGTSWMFRPRSSKLRDGCSGWSDSALESRWSGARPGW